MKFNKKIVLGVGAIVAIVGIAFAFFTNKELDVAQELKPKFSGYSERGTLSYDSDKVTENITAYLLEKEGVKQEIIDGILREDDNVLYSILNSPELSAKVSKVENDIEGITFGFDKSSDLKNGDEVEFSLEKVSEDIPVKAFTKKFTVEGLKKSEHITLDTIIKDNPLSFEGFDGAGELKSTNVENLDQPLFDMPKGNEELSNGDKVKINVNEAYISQLEEKGTIFDGEKETTVSVSGLKDFSTISNIDEILSLVDDVAKSKNKDQSFDFINKSITHKLERVSTYISRSDGDYLVSEEEADLYFNIVSIYKVDVVTNEDGKKETNTHYSVYGYRDVPYVNEKLKLNDLNIYTLSFGNEYKDEDSVTSELKSADSSFSELTN